MKISKNLRPFKQTDHDALTVEGWDGRDTEIHIFTCNLDLKPAVLRKASLGDVELCKDLETRDDG